MKRVSQRGIRAAPGKTDDLPLGTKAHVAPQVGRQR